MESICIGRGGFTEVTQRRVYRGRGGFAEVMLRPIECPKSVSNLCLLK